MGRRTYELFVDYWPTATTDKEIIADRLNELPKLVFSNTLSKAPWGEWLQARVVHGDAVTEIERLKAQDGKHMVLRGAFPWPRSSSQRISSTSITSSSARRWSEAGRLFPGVGDYTRLRRVNVRTYYTGVVFLHDEPHR